MADRFFLFVVILVSILVDKDTDKDCDKDAYKDTNRIALLLSMRSHAVQ